MRRPFSKHRGAFSMKATGKTAEILIYDVIGEDWFGGVTSKDFLQQLAGLGDVDEITVRINSPGGDVFEGVAIYNALKTHPAKVNVQIDSLAASIATVIAMAGDTISISDSGMMMVHNASGVCFGEASDMRSMADLLDKIRGGMMLGAYARTGKSADELTSIMDAETWYTAQEAVDAGWADSITTVPVKKAEARSKYDLSAFKHPPKAISSADVACKCSCEACLAGDCAGCTHDGCDCEGCDCDQETSAKAAKTAENEAKAQEIEQLAMTAARNRELSLRLAEMS